MSCNDVYMILYAQKAKEINRQFEKAKGSVDVKPASYDTLRKLGS